eukprot:5990522-Lingulodinium_polyedra.AAC.1
MAPLRTEALDLPEAGFRPVALSQAAGQEGREIEKRMISKLLSNEIGAKRLKETGLRRPCLDPALRRPS